MIIHACSDKTGATHCGKSLRAIHYIIVVGKVTCQACSVVARLLARNPTTYETRLRTQFPDGHYVTHVTWAVNEVV